jgi:hypothetical protein
MRVKAAIQAVKERCSSAFASVELLILLFSIASGCQGCTSVSVKVVDHDTGTPISGATVRAEWEPLPLNPSPVEARTTANGSATLCLPTWCWNSPFLTATAPGYLKPIGHGYMVDREPGSNRNVIQLFPNTTQGIIERGIQESKNPFGQE